MTDFNKFDFITESLGGGLKEAFKQLNRIGDVGIKKDVNQLFTDGIEALNKVDQQGMDEMEARANSFKDKMFEINKDSINDFKKWQ